MQTAESQRVVWFVGLSGAGKSTLCRSLESELRDRGQTVVVLDGDEVRKTLCSDLGFSEDDRAENIRRIASVAEIIANSGATVLVATISPLKRFRDIARTILPTAIEVFVDAPLKVCESRDPKGLYRLARSGKLRGFTGIDFPFEPPQNSHVICRTAERSIKENTVELLEFLGENPLHQGARYRQPTLAVDFDGVIAEYDGWEGRSSLGAPRPDVVAALVELKSEGWKIIVHTSRSASDIRSYLEATGIPFDEINRNSDYACFASKPVASVYWDDRALTYSGNAQRDLPMIRSFRTWNGRR